MIKSDFLSGETAGAGEVGHMVMDPGGPVCDVCGNTGCLDAMASKRAIRHEIAHALAAGASTVLRDACADIHCPTMSEILCAQEQGDALVCAVMDRAVTWLVIALANIVNLISPRAVMVDGLMMSFAQNRERLVTVALKHVWVERHRSGYPIFAI